jgi:signal transduction histidine kinase
MSQGRNLQSTLLSVPGRVLGGFVVAILTLILGTIITVQTLSARTSTSRSVERTFVVLRTTEMLLDEVNDSQLALTEFIITADPQFLEPFDNARRSMPGTLDKLRELTAGRAEIESLLDELEPLLKSALDRDQKEIDDRRAGASVDELRPKLLEGKALLESSASILERIRDDTGRILESEQRALEGTIRSSTIVVIAGDLILLLLVIAAAVLAVRDASEKARAVQFQRRVLGMVGHDLRNPLSVVLMAATQLAKTTDPNDRRQGPVARIVAAVSRMDRMIRDLFDYSRIELRLALPLDIRPSDVDMSCTRVVDELRAVNPNREIRYEPGSDPSVRWDSDRMEQVLENLLGNALKYSPPATPVQLRWRNESGGIVLEVENQGDPIAPDLLPHVFEPFRSGTGHDARTAKASMGLGLYIVRHIVKEHGGSIDVSSVPGATIFTVRLPQHTPTPTHAAA